MRPLPAAPATGAAADLVRAGRITAALDLLLAEAQPSVPALALTLECRLVRGEMDLAGRCATQLSARPDRAADEPSASLALAQLAAATERDEDAVRHAAAVGTDALPWRQVAAPSLIRLGRRREGVALATEQLALARAGDSAYDLAGALRTVAAVSVVVDHAAHLREALALTEGRYARLAAQTATDLAGLLALTGADDTEAVALLREAEEYADLEDLWPLHTRVRRLLERLGEQPRLPRNEAMARLTATQLLVCTLAATGGTNRAIADHLDITVKAVEWHLSHAYKKLEISRRSELPGVLRLP